MDLKDKAGELAGSLGDLLKGGGARSILDKLGSAGLGDVASSWIAKGKNLPIPPDILKKVLDNDTIAKFAAKLGITNDQATQKLAETLPEAIDEMTPDGQPPAEDAEPPSSMAMFRRLFGGAGKSSDGDENGPPSSR
jgi:uncharacterized protein YidB (DUF937 family)